MIHYKQESKIVNGRIKIKPEYRRERIIFYCSNSGFVTVKEIADYFEISTMTVLRDLRILHKQGKLVRVHGGALKKGFNND